MTASHFRIIGIGSPHGSDEVGWLVAEQLSRRPELHSSVLSLVNPLEILDHLDDCDCLMIIDACITGAEVGSVTRLSWPDRRILTQQSLSSHGFGVGETLQLADRLEKLPKCVVLYCLEVSDINFQSPEIDKPIPGFGDLEQRVLEEVQQWRVEQLNLLERTRDA